LFGANAQVTGGGDLELHAPLGGTILVNHTDLLVTLATLRQELDLVKQEHNALLALVTEENKALLALVTEENNATRRELEHVTAQLNSTIQALTPSAGMNFVD